MAKGLGGDASAFFVGTIDEAPWDIITALGIALTVLSWFENLPKDEQPPRSIWWSEELVEEWFEEVRKKRKASSGSRRKSPYDEADDAPMSRNELLDRSNLK